MHLLLSSGLLSRRHWSVEEEEAVKRGVSKFGPGSWKEIKDDDSALANRSPVQIKEKVNSLCYDILHLHGGLNIASL